MNIHQVIRILEKLPKTTKTSFIDDSDLFNHISISRELFDNAVMLHFTNCCNKAIKSHFPSRRTV